MDAALAAVRAVHLGATIVLFGNLAYVWFVSPARVLPPRFRTTMGWSVALAAASAIAWLALEAVSMSGLPVANALAPATVATVVWHTTFGHVWIVRIALLGICATAIGMGRNSVAGTAHAVAIVAAFGFVASLACVGHAAAARGPELALRLIADGAHVVAASAWVGALVPLILTIGDGLRRRDDDVHLLACAASQRFSWLGTVSVGTILVSGIVSAGCALHRFPALYETGYGRMVCAKLMLFAIMVALAAVNRFRLAPRLGRTLADDGGLRLLRRNAVIELLLGIAIVGIVAQLGMTMPPQGHSHMAAGLP